MSAARSSDQPRAPGWCAARVCRIDGPGIPAEVLGDPANDRWLLDAGDDAQPAAALPAGLDVDGEHPPIRQWVLSFPYPLRFLFAHRREVMGRVLGIVYRCIATHLTGKAGYFRRTAQTGAVTLLQRFGSALNLNVRFHMLFLDGVYVERHDGSLWFRWVTAPTSVEPARLTQALALRIGWYLERQGPLEREAQNCSLTGDDLEAGPMAQLLGVSITYCIAVGPHQGRKVFTLQTLPGCDEPFEGGVGKVAGFSPHAGIAARADQRQKLERLCRYISRPATRFRLRTAESTPSS